MATFYVLSSRHVLGQRFSEMLSALFPGVRTTPWDWPDLGESLAALVEERSDAFIVYREDLDDQGNTQASLQRDFGASADDQIIEIDVRAGLDMFASHLAPTPQKAA